MKLNIGDETLATFAGIGIIGFIISSLINNNKIFPVAGAPTTTSTTGATSGPGTLTQPSATGAGVTDAKGIKWLYADGDITTIAQSRTASNDHRWSGNVSGLGKLGMEATMIVDFTSASVASGGHFAKKMSGGNHSGSGAGSQKWYDFGIRANGAIQVQTEHPHPNNHTYACSDVGGCSVSNIGKGMAGNIIGLKWVCQPQGSGNFAVISNLPFDIVRLGSIHTHFGSCVHDP